MREPPACFDPDLESVTFQLELSTNLTVVPEVQSGHCYGAREGSLSPEHFDCFFQLSCALILFCVLTINMLSLVLKEMCLLLVGIKAVYLFYFWFGFVLFF